MPRPIASLILLAIFAANQAFALDCIRFERYIHVDGVLEWPQGGVEAAPPYVCMVARDSFAVVDVSNPTSPQVIGRLFRPGWMGLWAANSERALISGQEGFEIVSLADPSSPRIEASVRMPVGTRHASFHGDWLVILTGTDLLRFDLAGPPVLVDSIPGYGASVAAADGDYVYSITDIHELQVLDVGGAVPALVGGFGFLSTGSEVIAARSGFVYLAQDYGEDSTYFQVFDLTDPQQPLLAGQVIVAGAARQVVLSGDRALAASTSSLQVIDISDPGDPRDLGRALDWSAGIHDIAALDQVAVLGTTGAALIVDPWRLVPPEPHLSRTPVHGGPLAVAGEKAYIAQNLCYTPPHCRDGMDPGARIFSLADPVFPVDEGVISFGRPGCCNAAVDIAADASDVVWLSDIVGVFLQCDSYYLPSVYGIGNEISLRAEFAFAGGDSFVVIRRDCRDAPYIAASIRFDDRVEGIALDGSHAFLACGTAGLQVVDISAPESPLARGSIAWQHAARHVTAEGNYAFVTDSGSGLLVVNVSDPNQPLLAGRAWCPVAGPIMKSGNTVYVAGGNAGVLVFDVTNPSQPQLLRALGNLALDVALYQGAVCATTGFALDVFLGRCDPATPVALHDLGAHAGGNAIEITWRAQQSAAFHVLRGVFLATDIVDIGMGMETSAGEWRYVDRSVSPGETYNYWVRTDEGSRFGPVIATAAELPLHLRRTGPHPAKGSVNFELHMPRAARAHIEVFDVAGRRVRRLDLGQLRAGPQVLLWDGRDDHGRNVAAGVYAIRMISDAGNVGTRVVLLRE